MVKVRKGKRGHRKSRSLVFRISRTVPKSNFDDSSIHCPSAEDGTLMNEEHAENVLNEEHVQNIFNEEHLENVVNEKNSEIASRSLKIKIPKSVLNQNTEAETALNQSQVLGDLMLENDEKYSEFSNTDMDCLNYNITKSSANTTQAVTEEVENRKSRELRRSSRRILLRVQKQHQSTSSTNQTSNIDKAPVMNSSTSGQLATTSIKRKRGRKPGPRAVEGKKRKYARRGRPPKVFNPSNLGIIKPIITGIVPHENEKYLLQSPKNSVWTLVPKKLFDSDYFQSQILKVRFSSSTAKPLHSSISATPRFSSSTATPSALFNNGKIQFRRPRVTVNTLPAIQQDIKDCKRPTVIYFKTENKKNLEYSTVPTEYDNTRPLFGDNQFSKTQNDLLHLFNKYHVLDDSDLKNYYESANGDLNATENLLSDLFSENQRERNSCILQNNVVSESVPDFRSNNMISDCCGTEIFSGSLLPADDVDTLSRSIIVESLRALYCEEAVLS